MVSEIHIKTDLLIGLVRDRPALWDKMHDNYKDRKLTVKNWNQVCRGVYEEFDLLEEADKGDFAKLVMKRWANIRDNFMKCHKKLIEDQQPGGARKKRKYMFYDELQFLQRIAQHRDLAANPDQDESQSSTTTKADSDPPQNDLDKRMLAVIEQNQSRMMCFFRSIAPTVEKLSDEDVITFQFEVMKLLKKMTTQKPTQAVQSLEHLDEADYSFKLEPGSSSELGSPSSEY